MLRNMKTDKKDMKDKYVRYGNGYGKENSNNYNMSRSKTRYT